MILTQIKLDLFTYTSEKKRVSEICLANNRLNFSLNFHHRLMFSLFLLNFYIEISHELDIEFQRKK